MYRVLLVDDEAPLLTRMEAFDWAGQGCVCVGKAQNGEQALALCRTLMPHVVITDINMPVMDGLTLMKRLKAELPEIQVLLLTVYRDFDYAQEALQYGAVDYLVKDMDFLQHLPQVLARAVKAFDKNDSGQQKRAHLLQSGGRLLTCMLPQLPDDDETRAFFARYGGTLAVAVVESGEELLPRLDALLGAAADDVGLLLRAEGQFELMIPGEPIEVFKRVRAFLARAETPQSVHIALHGGVDGITTYERARPQALSTLQRGFYETQPQVQYAVNEPFPPIPGAHEQQWLQGLSLLGADGDGIRQYLTNDILPQLLQRRCDPGQVRALLERMLHRFESDYARRTDLGAYEAIRKAHTLQDAADALTKAIARICQSQSGYSYMVDEALEYIGQNIDNPELSLQTTADSVHISPGYLSKRIKEETGLSFQEQLMRMRMTLASSLLRAGKHKVYEVALRTGYRNYRTFAAAFERCCGCSPKKFK